MDQPFSRSPKSYWGQPLTASHKLTLEEARSRASAKKMLAGLPERVPLDATNLGELNRYCRYALGAEGIRGWSKKAYSRFGVGQISLDSMEAVTHRARGNLHSPLNIRYLLNLPAIADALFTEGVNCSWMNESTQAHFWKLAWDYACAVEHHWRYGGFIGVKYQEQFGCTRDALPHRILDVKQHIVKAMHRHGIEGDAYEWCPQNSPYAPYLSLAMAEEEKPATIDAGVVAPALLSDAHELRDMVWHLAAYDGGIGAVTQRLKCTPTAMDAFLDRYMPQEAPTSRYHRSVLRHLPELFTRWQETLPAEVFTPYEQARFLCYLEDYLYAALDCAYTQPRHVRGAEAVKDIAEHHLEFTVPFHMAALAEHSAIPAAAAALACDNSLLFGIAQSERRQPSAPTPAPEAATRWQERAAVERQTKVRSAKSL